MTVSRLAHIPGIGVNVMGDRGGRRRRPDDAAAWRTSTPTCDHPPSQLEHTRQRGRGRRGQQLPAVRGAPRPPEQPRPAWSAGSAGASTTPARVRQRRRWSQRHPQRPPGHHRAGRRGRAVRPDLRRPGQPDPAGGRRARPRPRRPHAPGLAHRPRRARRRGRSADRRGAADGPSMPTGAVFDRSHLDALAGPVLEHGAWILYDAAMERIRFDDRPARASRVAPPAGRTRHHRRLGVQGAADDRLAGRVGRRAPPASSPTSPWWA